MSAHQLDPEFVETFPSTLRPGVLYVSIEFTTCAHLCACGCGEEVITPLSPAQWALTYDGRDISLHPSVGNWSLPCQSHYFIRRGSIQWSYQFTKDQIASNRARDRRALNGHGSTSDDTIPASIRADTVAGARMGLWHRLRHWLRSKN